MRALTNSPGYDLCLKDPVEDMDPQNPRRHIIIKPGLRAKFIGDTTAYEVELGKKRFKFNGLPVDQDSGLPVDPTYRLATFDTTLQGWDKQTQKEAEKLLSESAYNGSDFIIVDTPRRPAPWTGYDSLRSVKKIIELVTATGSDVEEVLSYEIENANRPEVVEALQVILAPPADPDAVVVSA